MAATIEHLNVVVEAKLSVVKVFRTDEVVN
jgi:hypothetical protein